MAAISYQPWKVGDTYPGWLLPIMTDDGPENLTDIDITKFTLSFRTFNGTETAGTGAISLYALYPGYLLYKPSQADVSAAFDGHIVIRALYPPSNSTADKVVFDPIPFTISAS